MKEKCGKCKYFRRNNAQLTQGYCGNPTKRVRSNPAYLKRTSSPACSSFKPSLIDLSEVKKHTEMKAYMVWDKEGEGATVVFAETAGKARALALSTDTCEDAEFINIVVHRMKDLDKCYSGEWEMDWAYDNEMVLILVRDHGWGCDTDYVDIDKDCAYCIAKEYCGSYEYLTS